MGDKEVETDFPDIVIPFHKGTIHRGMNEITILHSEWLKLDGVLAILSEIWLTDIENNFLPE